MRAGIDTIVSAETPEGILLELRPAGACVRAYAYIIDLLIRGALLYVVGIISVILGRFGMALGMILFFLLEWFYPVIFELSKTGATPGKRTMRIKVVMDNGLPVTPAASITRNLLRAADFLPMLFGFGMLSMLLRPDFKRLGDLAAATLVVYLPLPAAPLGNSALEPVAPAMSLGLREQSAVLAYAGRVTRLTGERADELSALATCVTGTQVAAGPARTERLLAVAQWLLGRR